MPNSESRNREEILEILEWMEAVEVGPHSCLMECGTPEIPGCPCESKMARIRGVLASSESGRNQIIEEVAKSIEAAPLTYAGPDPHVVSDLRYLIVCAIRDMKVTASRERPELKSTESK